MAKLKDKLISASDAYFKPSFTENNVEQWFDVATNNCSLQFIFTIPTDEEVVLEDEDAKMSKEEKAMMESLEDGKNEDMDDMDRMLFLEFDKELKKNSKDTRSETIRKNELFTRIENQMKEYREDCANIKVIDYVNKYGNEKYKNMKKKDEIINYNKFTKQYLDVNYITSLSDVTLFWKDMHTKYNFISIYAMIILGKPTHNAFQERVFSRGTYTDTKLKKRLTERSFEMSVLNAVNAKNLNKLSGVITSINETLDKNISEKKKMLKMHDELKLFNSRAKRNVTLNTKDTYIYVKDKSIDSVCTEIDILSDSEISEDDTESDNCDQYFEEYKNTTNENIQEEIEKTFGEL